MKLYNIALFITMLPLLLTGCRNQQTPIQPTPMFPVQEASPAPSLSISTTVPPPSGIDTSLAPTDPDEARRQQGVSATVEGFYHRPFDELPQALRDTLTWDGQVSTMDGYHFRLRRYEGPGIVITTTEVEDEALRAFLESQSLLPEEERECDPGDVWEEYEREKDREWLYSVTITDDSYATLLGLKVGDTLEEAETLGYPLRQRLNRDGEATFGDTWEHSMRVRVKDDVIEELYLTWGIGRYTGKYWDL